MKKYLSNLLLVGILISIGLGCTSGQQSLKQGNYYQAVMKAVNRLRNNPNQKKAQETLREGYPMSIDWFIDQSQNALASNSPNKWKRVVSNYEQINRLYEAIKRSPGALRVIPNPTNYYDKLVESKNNAALESYDAGLMAFNDNTRVGAKSAYFHFMEADRYVPGFKDTRERIRESKYMATLKVVVDQIPVPSTRYQVSADFFQQKIQEFLNSYNTNEFVRFYSPLEADREKMDHPDHVVTVQFKDFVVGESHVKETVEHLIKEDVKVGEVEIEKDSVIDVLGNVKAKLTTFRKELRSSGILHMLVTDAHNHEILYSENFNGEFVWSHEWGHFNGDERALNKHQIAVTRRKDALPPDHQELFVGFTQPIYDQITTNFRRFYNRY